MSGIKKIFNKRYLRTWLQRLVIWRIDRLPDRQFLYLLSLIVGIASGLAALILKSLVHFVAVKLVSWSGADFAGYTYLIYPLIGIFVTVLFVRYVVKDNIGHGVSKILHSISQKNSRLKTHNTWSSMVASSLTIGFGGSVGAEAPIVLTGASIGSNLARLFRLNDNFINLMLGCGAAGAIAGIFNAPIAGIVFTLEVLMLDLSMVYLIPLLISTVTATLISYFFMGEDVLLHFTQVHSFEGNTFWQYILLGVFTGLLAIYFTRMSIYVEEKFKAMNSWVVKIAIGGLIMGVMVLLFPSLWGEGYREIAMIFKGHGTDLLHHSLFFKWRENPYLLLLFLGLLLFLKVIAMASTMGAGGVGGIFAPTLFMGAVAGVFFATFMNTFGNFELHEDLFVLTGMAGMMAAVMHAPLTAIFLTAEMTRGYELIVPLIISSTTAYLTIINFESYSLYARRLAHDGYLLTHHKDQTVLRMMNVRQLVETDFEILSPDASLGDLVKAISVSHRNLYPVVDENGILKGMVKLSDVRSQIFKHELYDKVMVKDLMYMPEWFISPEDSMEKVAEKFETSGRYNLAVIEDGKYLGFLSRAVVFSKYRKTLQKFSNE